MKIDRGLSSRKPKSALLNDVNKVIFINPRRTPRTVVEH